MSLKRYIGITVAVNVLFACNATKFISSPNSGKQPNPPSSQALSCTAAPLALRAGTAVTIQVTAGASVPALIFESIVGEDAPTAVRLKRDGSTYIKEAGGANSITPMKNASHTIELRLTENSPKPDATCSFVVSDNPGGGTEPGPADIACGFETKTVLAGANLAIEVKSSTLFHGTIQQNIQGPTNSTNELKLVGGTWVRSDGSANEIQFGSAGDYSISLSPLNQPAAGLVIRGCTVKVQLPICSDGKKSIGAHVAFIVDNSNSNSTTDCPNPLKIGTFNGATTYQCQGETNREKAVKSSFDILASVASREASNPDATSTVAIASFPTQASYTDGWKIQSNGWLNASGATDRQALVSSMAFSRSPFGLTPYGSGLSAATELFSTAPKDGKAKILVFVTDGEPTDRDPIGIVSQAAAIQSGDVEIITVFITGSETRAQRKANHADMLRQFNTLSIQDGSGPWYTSNISSFDQYIGLINGTAQVSDLVSQMSTKADLSCVEQAGKKCSRLIVEVSNSASLQSVLETIIKTPAIKCE